ncbi:Hypothetical predicted protein [Pelobates cultripes]|uniref:Envelope protein n=1 Tax=Pelobates cultripes TaxID=61616 RepID=A0AAD1R9J9_PELCU|nr:Hypothetical predicted protein [Pelobates cultripes]
MLLLFLKTMSFYNLCGSETNSAPCTGRLKAFCWKPLLEDILTKCPIKDRIPVITNHVWVNLTSEVEIMDNNYDQNEHLNVTILRWAYFNTQTLTSNLFMLLPYINQPIFDCSDSRVIDIHLPFGVYYLCGSWAVKRLPCNWVETCYLGNIIPALTLHENLPEGRVRNKRKVISSKKDKTERTVKSGEEDRLFAGFVPIWGVIELMYKLNLLGDILDEAFNNTGDAIEKLSAEQEQASAMIMQNRFALDYLLASEGGVCALIKTRCCLKIDNVTGQIHTDVDKLHEVQIKLREVHNTSSGGLNWGFDWSFF